MRESLDDRRNRLVSGSRAQVIRDILHEALTDGAVGDDRAHALAMLMVDATLDADEVALHVASRQLQQLYRVLTKTSVAATEVVAEDRGRVLALLDVAAWALERTLSLDALAEFEEDSSSHAFLKAVMEQPGRTNSQIADAIDISNGEVSRLGRRLCDSGLAAKRRVGRRNHWEVTPKGLEALELLENGGAPRAHRPHFQIQ